MSLDVEINPDNLGDIPIYPPRRILRDFIPTRVKTFFRKRYDVFPASPLELWILQSLFLRIFYNTYRVSQLIEKQPKPFYTSELPKQSKPYTPEGGWN